MTAISDVESAFSDKKRCKQNYFLIKRKRHFTVPLTQSMSGDQTYTKGKKTKQNTHWYEGMGVIH